MKNVYNRQLDHIFCKKVKSVEMWTHYFCHLPVQAAASVSGKKLGSKIDIEHRFFTQFYLRYDYINWVLVAPRTQKHDCFYSSTELLFSFD